MNALTRMSPARWGYLIPAAGLSLYAHLYLASFSMSIARHRFFPNPFSLIGAAVLFFLALIWAARLIPVPPRSQCEKLIFLPLYPALLSPLMLSRYLTAEDLRDRLLILGTAMLIGQAVLVLYQRHHDPAAKHPLRVLQEGFFRMPQKSRLWILFIAAWGIYTLGAGVLVHKGLAYSGDEPYYLLTTHSFYQDRDLNLSNNYNNSDYFHFYPRELYPNLRIGAYARFGRKGTEYVYPISQPGVSALILPQYALSRLFKGRTLIFVIKSSLGIWGALLGLQIYLLALELWRKQRLALLLWALYGFTAPVFFFATHIYPEVPMALFAVFLYRKARSSSPLRNSMLLWMGALLGIFFWFGLKYNMIFWPLLIVCSIFMLKQHRIGWKMLYFVIPALLSQGLFYLYVYELYGTFNPIAIYEGVVSSNTLSNFRDVMFKTPLTLRIDTFFDYFLDQRDGLLLYSPLYFFVFPGLIEAFRKSRKDFLALLFIAAPFVMNYAFFAHRQGHSPQARVLMPLTWIGAVSIGFFLANNRKKTFSLLFTACAWISLSIAVLLFNNPNALYQPTTHEFTFRGGSLFIGLSNLNIYLPDFLPSFVKIDNLGYLPNYLWLAGIVLFIFAYLWKKDFRSRERFAGPAFLALAGVLTAGWLFAAFPRSVLLFPQRADFSNGHRLGFYNLDRHIRMNNAGEFSLTKDPETYELLFTSWKEIDNLEIEFGSLEGDYQAELRLFDIPLFQGTTRKEIKTISFPSPPLYRYKRTHLYRMTLIIRGASNVKTADNPYSLRIRPSPRKSD